MLLKYQLCRAIRVSRMGMHHLSRIIMCNELSAGHCDWGAPKKWFKDCWEKSIIVYHIDHHWWSTLAENCDAWCLTTNHVSSFENSHRAALKEKKTWEEELQHYAIKQWPAIPVPYWLCQPIIYLQLVWTALFLISISRRQAMMKMIEKVNFLSYFGFFFILWNFYSSCE